MKILLKICYPFPRRLLRYLRKRFRIEEPEQGVYEIFGEQIHIYLLVQSRLQNPEYLWLKNLSGRVKMEDFERMAKEARSDPEDKRKDKLFQFIGENNEDLWKGEKNMCRIFEEIEERGEKRGEKRGEERGENRMAKLIQILMKEEKYTDIALASSDAKRRQELYRAYGV